MVAELLALTQRRVVWKIRKVINVPVGRVQGGVLSENNQWMYNLCCLIFRAPQNLGTIKQNYSI